MSSGQMSTNQHEQEFTPEQNGQENSPSHSAQDSEDSDSDTVREHAPERDMATNVHTAVWSFVSGGSSMLVRRLRVSVRE